MIVNHVTSLELSKRLKELGVPQESHFYHSICKHCLDKPNGNLYWDLIEDEGENEVTLRYSAFLSSELGTFLPGYIQSRSASGSDKQIIYHKEGDTYFCSVVNENTLPFPQFQRGNEAEARGLMLAYLLENDLLNAEDLKWTIS